MTQLLIKNSWEKGFFPKLSEKKEIERLRNKPDDLVKKIINNSLDKVHLNLGK